MPKSSKSIPLEDQKKDDGSAEHHELKVRVPVHADIPHQEVIFLDETDPISSPMKAELGICGVAAAVANAIYNATGVRVHDDAMKLRTSSTDC